MSSDSPVGGDKGRMEICDRYEIEVPETEEAVDVCQLPLRGVGEVQWD